MFYPPSWYYQEDGVTIYHGDSRSILPQLWDGSIDVMWTDPPYGHGNHDGDLNARLNDHRLLDNKPIQNDSMEEMRSLLDFTLQQAARFLKRDCCCCCCCGGGGPKPTFPWVAQRMDTKGLSFFHSVIWDKRNPGLGWRFRRQHEMVMVAHRVGGTLSWRDDDRAVPNVLSVMPPKDRLHPNEKPQELAGWFLDNVVPKGGIVIDPFMGSGTTIAAAKARGIQAIGIEIEKEYCDIAIGRLRQKELQL